MQDPRTDQPSEGSCRCNFGRCDTSDRVAPSGVDPVARRAACSHVGRGWFVCDRARLGGGLPIVGPSAAQARSGPHSRQRPRPEIGAGTLGLRPCRGYRAGRSGAPPSHSWVGHRLGSHDCCRRSPPPGRAGLPIAGRARAARGTEG